MDDSDPQATYSKMSVGDVEAIGKHCQAAFCGQLDFLPFRCESCKGTFCLDHRTETAHSCAKAGEWARLRRQNATSSPSTPRPNILTHESQCSSPSCKTLINTPLVPGIQCVSCNRSYCLKHRLKEDHDCANLKPLGAVPKPDRGIGDALGKLRAWGAAKKAQQSESKSSSGAGGSRLTKTTTSSSTKSTSSQTLQRIISPFHISSRTRSSTKSTQVTALNTLKSTAKGDAKIPADQRIYVHLEAVREGTEGSAGAKIPRGDAFFSRDWSVGKVLDAAAKALQVTNVNNRGGGEETKLRVYHVEGGRLLEFGEKLGKGVGNGDTLVLLRGVGAPDE